MSKLPRLFPQDDNDPAMMRNVINQIIDALDGGTGGVNVTLTGGSVVNPLISGTPPSTPAGLVLGTTGLDYVSQANNAFQNLSWTANASGDQVLQYEIRYRKAGDSAYYTLQTGQLAIKVPGLLPNQSYGYSIRAQNLTGWSAFSSEALGTTANTSAPAQPATPVITPYIRALGVSWAANTEADLKGYVVEVSPNGTTGWTVIQTVALNTSTLYTPTTQGTYYFRVTAYNWAGQASLPSAVASGSTGAVGAPDLSNILPGVPAALAVSATGIDYASQTNAAFINLTWTANVSTDYVTSYEIKYRKAGDTVYYTAKTGNAFLKIGSLIPGQSYGFAIRAQNNLGNYSAFSTEVTSSAQIASAPATPTGLGASSLMRTIAVTWTANTEADLQGYQVQVSTDNVTFTTVLNTSLQTSYLYSAPSGTAIGTTYYFKIRALNWSGQASAYTASVSATTGGLSSADFNPNIVNTAAMVTGAVTNAILAANSVATGNIQANAVGPSQISAVNSSQLTSTGTPATVSGVTGSAGIKSVLLYWTALSINDAFQYEYSEYTGSSTATTPPAGSVTYPLTQSTFVTLTGRVTGQPYTYWVRAKNYAGTFSAAYSAPVTVTPVATNTADIAANAITQATIAANAVGTAQIAANAVTSGLIAASAVGNTQLAAGAVTAAKITAGTVTTNEIAAGTIVAGNIASGTITGTQIAATTIAAGNIVSGTITTSQIAASTITAGNIAASTITASQIAASTITAGQIAANTITATQIAAATITAGQIAANTITAGQIAAQTITAGQIAAGAVSTDKLTVGSFGDSALINGSFEDVGSSSMAANWTPGWDAGITGGGSAARVTTQQQSGAASAGLTASATQGYSVASDAVPVTPGDSWYVSAWYLASVATTVGVYLKVFWGTTPTFASGDASTTPTVIASNLAGPTVWTNASTIVVVPAGKTWMRVVPEIVTPNVAATLYWDSVEARKAVGTANILDASIITAKIANLAVGTAQIADASILNAKIANLAVNSAKISDLAVDKLTAGNLTVQALLTAGSIATAATGARLTMDSTGLKAYNSGGTNTVAINSDGTASFTGSITSGATITGATISGGTISIGTSPNWLNVDSSGLWMGAATFAASKFSVTYGGILVADSATFTNATFTGAISAGTSFASGVVVDSAIYSLTVTKLTAGNLTVQGVLTTGSLVTAATGARVAIDSSGIKAYNAGGTNTVAINNDGSAAFQGTITASTITGGTVQTATTLSRVVMDSTGLRFFATDGSTLNMLLKTSDGSITLAGSITSTATISGGTITGGTVTGGTINGGSVFAGTITSTATISGGTIIGSTIKTSTTVDATHAGVYIDTTGIYGYDGLNTDRGSGVAGLTFKVKTDGTVFFGGTLGNGIVNPNNLNTSGGSGFGNVTPSTPTGVTVTGGTDNLGIVNNAWAQVFWTANASADYVATYEVKMHKLIVGAPTLQTALINAIVYSSISVTSTISPFQVASGQILTLTSGPNSMNVVTSAAVNASGTPPFTVVVAINPVAANFAYPIGSTIALPDSNPIYVKTAQTTLRVPNLFPGAAYGFSVAAQNNIANKSLFSAEFNYTPPLDVLAPSTPKNLTVTQATKGIWLKWDPLPESDAWGVNIAVSTDGGANFTKVNNAPLTSTTFFYSYLSTITVTSGASATTLKFIVQAQDYSSNTSAWTDVAAGTAVAAPSGTFPGPYSPVVGMVATVGGLNMSELTVGNIYAFGTVQSGGGFKVVGATYSVQMDSTGLHMFANATPATYLVDINANGSASFQGTVTASTVQSSTVIGTTLKSDLTVPTTSTRGSWIIDTSVGMKFYDQNSNQVFGLDISTGNITVGNASSAATLTIQGGTLTSATISSSTVNGGTINSPGSGVGSGSGGTGIQITGNNIKVYSDGGSSGGLSYYHWNGSSWVLSGYLVATSSQLLSTTAFRSTGQIDASPVSGTLATAASFAGGVVVNGDITTYGRGSFTVTRRCGVGTSNPLAGGTESQGVAFPIKFSSVSSVTIAGTPAAVANMGNGAADTAGPGGFRFFSSCTTSSGATYCITDYTATGS